MGSNYNLQNTNNYYADASTRILNTPTSTATTISLSWTQPGSDVDSYTVSYTYTIRQCGPGVMSETDNVPNIAGSLRNYVLSGLEEDSDYTIIHTDIREAEQTNSDPLLTVSTTTAGTLIYHIVADVATQFL